MARKHDANCNNADKSPRERTPGTSGAPGVSAGGATAAPHDAGGQKREWREEWTGTVADRRIEVDRRQLSRKEADATGLERRRGPGRRRADFLKAADEGEMNQEQFMFLMAIDTFKRVNHKTFPSWTDVLEILRRLGYRKVQKSDIRMDCAEDWTEAADAPAVKPKSGQSAGDHPDVAEAA